MRARLAADRGKSFYFLQPFLVLLKTKHYTQTRNHLRQMSFLNKRRKPAPRGFSARKPEDRRDWFCCSAVLQIRTHHHTGEPNEDDPFLVCWRDLVGRWLRDKN
jgi:hypothetical protein